MAGSLLAHHVPHVHPLPPLQEEAWPCALGLGQALAKQHCSNLSALVLANDNERTNTADKTLHVVLIHMEFNSIGCLMC